MPAAEIGGILDQAFDIAVRPGLHCAPYVHRAIGTFPDGAVLEILLGGAGDGLTLDERLARERADVHRMGGRIVQNIQWTEVTRADH